jgi:16S rRNA (guanine527-N7)-methyltransferase
VTFEEELAAVLPQDIPHRSSLIEKSSEHLRLVSAANSYMNLTRISTPQEAAIKHVLDSVLPWSFFQGAKIVLDAGTGAGFPGIPLSLVLPETRFLLCESIGKKARFVDSAAENLELANVEVLPDRAELVAVARRPTIITARAVAPLGRLVRLFQRALNGGAHLLLYKGPDVEQELTELDGRQAEAQTLFQYELPNGFGRRTLVRVAAQRRGARSAS